MTAIRQVLNLSGALLRLLDIENPNVLGHGTPVGPGQSLAVDMWIPWAAQARDFPQHHLELQFDGQTRYWIWQAAGADGDFVRFSINNAWEDPGERVYGISAVSGDRTIVVRDGCFELVDLDAAAVLATLRHSLTTRNYWISGNPIDRQIASAPKTSSVAFSTAGIPSDAFDRGQPGARFMYRDSGKRYEFKLDNGVVKVIHPDGSVTELRDAVSYTRKRAGERFAAPSFDLITAGSGRMFAQEKDWDRFYFATLREHIRR